MSICSGRSTPSRLAMGLNTPDAWDGPCTCQSVAVQVVAMGGLLQQLQVQHMLLQQSVDQTAMAQQQQQHHFSMVQQQQQQELHWMQHAMIKQMLSGGSPHGFSASVGQFCLDGNTLSISHKPPLETAAEAKAEASATEANATTIAATTEPCTQHQEDKVEDSDTSCPSSNSSNSGFRCSTSTPISKQSNSSSSNPGSGSASNSIKSCHEVWPATEEPETRSVAANQSFKRDAKQATPASMKDAAAVATTGASTVTAVPVDQATSATLPRAVTAKVAALAANSTARDVVNDTLTRVASITDGSSSNRRSRTSRKGSKRCKHTRPAALATAQFTAATDGAVASQSFEGGASPAAPTSTNAASAVVETATATAAAVPAKCCSSIVLPLAAVATAASTASRLAKQASSVAMPLAATAGAATTHAIAADADRASVDISGKNDSESDQDSEDDLEMRELGWHPYYRRFLPGSSGTRTSHQRSSHTRADEEETDHASQQEEDEDLSLLIDEEDIVNTSKHAMEELSAVAASQETRCCTTANSWATYQAPTQSSRWPTARRCRRMQ